jgi:hypothetical protein
MTKKTVQLTQEELKKMIQLESGSKTAEVAEGVFKKLFEDARKAMDGKVSKMVYGGIIATVLVLIALVCSTWLFMSGYQQHYLDTQLSFNEQLNTLRKENMDLQFQLKNDIERTKNKQEYLERLLLDKK